MDWHSRVEEKPAKKKRDRSTLSGLSCSEHWPSGHQAYGVMETTRDVCWWRVRWRDAAESNFVTRIESGTRKAIAARYFTRVVWNETLHSCLNHKIIDMLWTTSFRQSQQVQLNLISIPVKNFSSLASSFHPNVTRYLQFHAYPK